MSVEQLFKFETAHFVYRHFNNLLTECNSDLFLIKTFKKAIGQLEKLEMVLMFFQNTVG